MRVDFRLWKSGDKRKPLDVRLIVGESDKPGYDNCGCLATT